MVSENKYGGLAFKIISSLFLIGAVVCLIVDFALNRTFSWSFYSAISILLVWVIMLPIFFIKKNKIIFSLAAATVAVFPYLYFLEKITPIKNWFYPLALPVAIVSVLITWIVFIVFRYLKINIWYKSAISVFLYGVVMSSVIRYYVAAFLGENLFARLLSLDTVINVLSCIAVAALTVVIGRQKSERLKDAKMEMPDVKSE